VELAGKPDFEAGLDRIEAWFNHEVLDRPPVRFAEHNAEFAAARTLAGRTWPDLKARWFELNELEAFIAAMKPDGLYLCIAAEENIQPQILRRLQKW
jgi:hypothetical protein